jgi:CheY-like chemotaxis protein
VVLAGFVDTARRICGTQQQLKRVLVVDDRPEVLEGISSVLSQLGFECDTAVSVAPAANLLGAHPYDMVFLDLDMPVKSGFDLAAETRRGEAQTAVRGSCQSARQTCRTVDEDSRSTGI